MIHKRNHLNLNPHLILNNFQIHQDLVMNTIVLPVVNQSNNNKVIKNHIY